MLNKLLMFGWGYAGEVFARRLHEQGWSIEVILRCGRPRQSSEESGVSVIDIAAADSIEQAVSACDALLVVAPPSGGVCPGARVLSSALSRSPARLRWLGYLSSTAVYGDQGGAWTDEKSPLGAASPAGVSRMEAERAWLELSERCALPLVVFRLAAIYGPGRSPLDRVRDGNARRIYRDNHVFSRIHVEDLAALLEASMQHASRGGIYNVSDDEPASSADVIAYAAGLLGVEPPPLESVESAGLSAAGARYFNESRRMSNALAKQALGWRPRYPSYREGLGAILEAEGAGPGESGAPLAVK